MIYGRRTQPNHQIEVPESNPQVVDPGTGAFAIIFNGSQVVGSASAGAMLAGSTSNITIRVRNDGNGSLEWLSYTIGGYAASWLTNTDGAAISLSPGDYQDLVFRVTVPSQELSATRYADFTMIQALGTLDFSITIDVQEQPVIPPTNPPSAPTNVTATSGDGQFVVTWTNSAGATSHLMRYGLTHGGPYFSGSVQVQSPGASCTVAATNGVKYFGVVIAQNADTGASGESVEFIAYPEAVIPPDPGPFDMPTGLSVVHVGSTHVDLAWNAVSGAEFYPIFVYDSTASTLLQSPRAYVESATITGLDPSTTYQISIAATELGTGSQSNTTDKISVTTEASGDVGPGTDALPRSETMTIYSYHAYSYEQPFGISDNIQTIPIVVLSHPASATAIGISAAAALSGRPPENRAIGLAHVGYGRTDIPDINTAQTPMSFVESNGYALDSVWTGFMEEFCAAFSGVPVKYVVLDNETFTVSGSVLLPLWYYLGSTASERASKFAGIYGNPDLVRRLPLALRQSSVAELATIEDAALSPHRDLAGLWDWWVTKKAMESLREVVGGAWERASGVRPVVFNYEDARSARAYDGIYGEHHPSGDAAVSEVSSIATYLSVSSPYVLSDYYRTSRGLPVLTKAHRWNFFIWNLNRLRSMKYPQIPWFSNLRYKGDYLAEDANPQNVVDIIRHMGAMGISEAMWFSHLSDQGGFNEMQQTIERVRVYPRPARRLPVIKYDADEVVTGSIRTTYNESDWTPGGTYEPLEY